MFGIALEIDPADFTQVRTKPGSIIAGVAAQFLLLPFLTFLIVILLNPHPALALGMILVAACPGGNISNFMSALSQSNIALSITLTAISTLLTPIFTPLNFELWASAAPETHAYLQTFQLSFSDILTTVLLLLVLPLILGMLCRRYFRPLTQRISKPVRVLSLLILVGFIAVGLANNFEVFKAYFGVVFGLVLLHNAVALLAGYGLGSALKLDRKDRQTVCIETGIQNSGLGLIIIFTFFGGNGGMALIAAWWGIWHIVSGLAMAYLFTRPFNLRRA